MDKLYTVRMREVHVSDRDVMAESYEEAVTKASEGDWIHESSEYSHSPDMPIEILDGKTGKTLVEDWFAEGCPEPKGEQ